MAPYGDSGVEKVSVVHPGEKDNGERFRGSLWTMEKVSVVPVGLRAWEGVVAFSG